MKRLFFLLFMGLALIFSRAQTLPTRKIIDSLIHKRLDSASINLDSLADPKLIKIDTKKVDTIITRHKVALPKYENQMPVTPYLALNSEDAKQWFYYGQNNLLFNQAAFSHWNAGGNNNFGMIGKVNYTIIYKVGKHFWENNIQLGYGIVSLSNQKTQKTEDYINFTTNYGYDLKRNYYLSAGFQFLSQFAPGYNYALTPNPVYENRISNFMAPGYLNIGVGILYNPQENFQVTLRPVNGRFTFVLDPVLQRKGLFGLTSDGQSVRTELGAMLNASYKLQIIKDMSFTNQISFFSNYLFHSERVDVIYNAVLSMKFNKYISTVISLDMLYDHDQIQKLQLKQTLGVGLSYNFGTDLSKKPERKKNLKPFIN